MKIEIEGNTKLYAKERERERMVALREREREREREGHNAQGKHVSACFIVGALITVSWVGTATANPVGG